jgi:hypothetical protein
MNPDDSDDQPRETGDPPPAASVPVSTTAPEVAEITNNQLQEGDPLSEIEQEASPHLALTQPTVSGLPSDQDSPSADQSEQAAISVPKITLDLISVIMGNLVKESEQRSADRREADRVEQEARREADKVEQEQRSADRREADKVEQVESGKRIDEALQGIIKVIREDTVKSMAIQAETLQAMLADSEKHAVERELLAEAKREAERVAAIEHALQAKQQAEESRAKEQKSVERRSAFEQIEKESAEWQRRKLAEYEQGSYVFKFAFPISFLAQASADTRKWADAVQSCLTAPAILVDHPNAKVFTVVSSSTVWDPGGTSPCCAATKDETTNRANDRQEKDTSSVWLFLPRQQACERLEEEGRGTTYST